MMNIILVTGAAGFIGANLVNFLLNEYKKTEVKIIGIDNLNDYYDVNLKLSRLAKLQIHENFIFVKDDISDEKVVNKLFDEYKPNIVVNLAAQAGVRYSIENPQSYLKSNVIGFFNILEACRHHMVDHLVFASSSSVYGDNEKIPYSTRNKTDKPVSFYAATKKADEAMAYSYAKLYKIPTTALRFFSVYGPAGRPDMAYFKFTNKLVNGEDIQIYNYGRCKRDFTYVDDVVKAVSKVMKKPAKANKYKVRYKVYNIGNNKPKSLLKFVDILQQELIRAGVLPSDYNFEAHKKFVPMQPGDVETTYADIDDLIKDFNFKPSTSLRKGLRAFAKWYKEYYKQGIDDPFYSEENQTK